MLSKEENYDIEFVGCDPIIFKMKEKQFERLMSRVLNLKTLRVIYTEHNKTFELQSKNSRLFVELAKL